jgi:uncharacterized membrane protein YfcA
MTPLQALLLFLAALLAGALNSVAGGGSFISFPALITIGHVPLIPANATNTVALWPGSVASVGAYRRELAAQRRVLFSLGGISLLGGYIGARLLLKTPEAIFIRLLPFLLLTATLLFAFGGRVNHWLGARSEQAHGHSWTNVAGASLFQLVIATYGGYFGGGIGMLMLAMLAVMGMDNIHAMNALKTVLASCINGVAVVTFILAGKVFWPEALLMIAGAIAGGYGGAHYAQKIAPRYVRRFVLLVGFGMTIYFFVYK